jgi:hypothetical protein
MSLNISIIKYVIAMLLIEQYGLKGLGLFIFGVVGAAVEEAIRKSASNG